MVLILNIFQIYNKSKNIPAPLTVYFKICIITLKHIDKWTCTFTTHTSNFITRFGFIFLDNIFRMTLVDFTIEDEELFILLKRQCLHGVLSEFRYLVNTRVEPQEKKRHFWATRRTQMHSLALCCARWKH